MDILIEEFNGGFWTAALKNGRLEGIEIDPPQEPVRWGDVYMGIVRRIDKANDSAIVEIEKDIFGYLNAKDVYSFDKNRKASKISGAIGQTLQTGSKIIVQAKEGTSDLADKPEGASLEYKYPRLSMDIAIQGRYMIFTPHQKENRVSQRIRNKKLRGQLVEMLDDMTGCEGCILRAAAHNTQTDILKAEADQLNDIWDRIEDSFKGEKPKRLSQGPNAIGRLLSDHARENIEVISVVTMDHLNAVQDWCERFAPDLVTKIEPVEIPNAEADLGLFEFRDVIGQIEALFHPYCLVDGGGSIIIQETTALTAVDVNRGGDSDSNLAINIKVAKMLARQLRLRNIGGIIMCDFLRMRTKTEKKKLEDALAEQFEFDPCTVQIHGFTNLGLIELTRQRRTPSLRNRIEEIDFVE